MERGEHEVAGERRLDRDLGGLRVPDLAHEDNIRVLPENGTESGGKAQMDLCIHLYLTDPLELVFDGVLDGDDVLVRRIDLRQRGIQGRGFAAAGGTGHENNPVGPGYMFIEPGEGIAGEPDLIERQERTLTVQEPQHNAFAEGRGH